MVFSEGRARDPRDGAWPGGKTTRRAAPPRHCSRVDVPRRHSSPFWVSSSRGVVEVRPGLGFVIDLCAFKARTRVHGWLIADAVKGARGLGEKRAGGGQVKDPPIQRDANRIDAREKKDSVGEFRQRSGREGSSGARCFRRTAGTSCDGLS